MATLDKWIKKWHNVDGKWEIELTINPKYVKKMKAASSRKRRKKSADEDADQPTKKTRTRATAQKKERITKWGIYQLTQENYKRALESPEWQQLSNTIITRDHGKCQVCGATTELRVHHKYYIKGRTIWNYPSDALQTLCEACHTRYHDAHKVDVYDSLPRVGMGYRRLLLEPCPRCAGKGFIAGYDHVEGGTCFLCFGSGYYNLFEMPVTDSNKQKKEKNKQ